MNICDLGLESLIILKNAPYSVAFNFFSISLCASCNMCSISLIVGSYVYDEVNEDDIDGCASGDAKSSDDDDDDIDDDDDDDDDSEVEVEDDGRKEKKEKEHEVLSKPKKKPQFSGASASAATPPEEAAQSTSKFCTRYSSLMMMRSAKK